jgi:hypothetical protein
MTSLIITLTEKLRPAMECEKKAFPFIVHLPVPILVGSNKPCHCNCKNVAIPKRLQKCLAVVMTKEKKIERREEKERRSVLVCLLLSLTL